MYQHEAFSSGGARMNKLWFLMVSILLLWGCSQEAEKPQVQDKEATPAAEEQASATSDAFEIGFVYVSPVGDAGWSHAHDQGRKALEGMEGVKTYFVESVNEGADSERVMQNMARKGYDLIFATSYGYMDPMLKVAERFPDTVFMHCSGFKRSQNMGTYFGRMYQARYLSGMVAGAMTKSNILGYVGAYPIPEVIRGINAFALGARAVNPQAQVRVVWSKTWYDPATEKEAAKSLLDVGADVIAQHQDSPAPQEAAQERGVYSVGYNTDMSSFAPKAHLTAPVWNWAPFYERTVKAVREGTWTSGDYWGGMDDGIVDLAPFGPMVPDEVRQQVEAKKQEILAGQEKVFVGPLMDQSGAERVAEGQAMTDEQLLGMDWFVEGVVGSTQ
jgi:basic membrane protein A and related proteins